MLRGAVYLRGIASIEAKADLRARGGKCQATQEIMAGTANFRIPASGSSQVHSHGGPQ